MTRTAPARRPRVLVVEDEYFVAADLAEELEASGAQVLAMKPTLAEARAAAAIEQPDVAVLDIDLRGEKVYPLADELLAMGVPIIFATGYDADAIPDRYAAVERWEKPVRVAQLADAVQRAVAPSAACDHEGS